MVFPEAPTGSFVIPSAGHRDRRPFATFAVRVVFPKVTAPARGWPGLAAGRGDSWFVEVSVLAGRPRPRGPTQAGLATYPTGPLPSGPSAAQAEDQLVDSSGTGSGSSRRPEPGLARRESGAAGSSPQDRVSACGRVPRPGVGISVRSGPRRAASGQRRGCPRRRRGPPAPPGGWRVRSRRPGAPPGPSSGPRGSRRSPSPCRADR